MKGFNEVMEMAADHFGIKSGDGAKSGGCKESMECGMIH